MITSTVRRELLPWRRVTVDESRVGLFELPVNISNPAISRTRSKALVERLIATPFHRITFASTTLFADFLPLEVALVPSPASADLHPYRHTHKQRQSGRARTAPGCVWISPPRSNRCRRTVPSAPLLSLRAACKSPQSPALGTTARDRHRATPTRRPPDRRDPCATRSARAPSAEPAPAAPRSRSVRRVRECDRALVPKRDSRYRLSDGRLRHRTRSIAKDHRAQDEPSKQLSTRTHRETNESRVRRRRRESAIEVEERQVHARCLPWGKLASSTITAPSMMATSATLNMPVRTGPSPTFMKSMTLPNASDPKGSTRLPPRTTSHQAVRTLGVEAASP